jgi:hypothetical protein
MEFQQAAETGKKSKSEVGTACPTHSPRAVAGD